jgi:hypothetical protein
VYLPEPSDERTQRQRVADLRTVVDVALHVHSLNGSGKGPYTWR